MTDRVTIQIESHVAEVALNRAEKMNAVDVAMFEALDAAAKEIANDRAVRAVVLRGEGENFCAGIDLGVLSNSDLDFSAALATPLAPSAANIFQRAAIAWRELPMPVICAVHGVAFGAGLQIALGADIRYASPDAQFSVMESKWGIIPDMGISATLRHIVAPDRAKELSWSARVFDSAEAASMGLVTAIVDDPVETSREFANQCASKSPDAMRGIKLLFNRGWDVPEAEALALEAELQSGIIGRANQIEAVQARLTKRAPDFKD